MKNYILGIFLAVFSLSVSAQEACMGLLNHGIYDEFVTSGVSSTYSEIRDEVCSSYQAYKNDSEGGSIEASYSLFSGGANYSSSKIKSVGKFMCESNYGIESAMADSKTITKQINSKAVSAFTQCVESSREDLFVETDYGSTVFDAIVISMRYRAAGTGVVVESIQYDESSLDCSGSLLSVVGSQQETLVNSIKSIRCVRRIPEEPTRFLNKKYWMLSTDITINTGAKTIVRRLPAVGVAPEPLSNSEKRLRTISPVGTIIASMLTWDEFKKSEEDVEKNWVPADGKNISIKSKYSRLFKKKSVPDLRGMFLRGLNGFGNGEPRIDGKEDPEGGGREAGGYQGGNVGAHNHSSSVTRDSNGPRIGFQGGNGIFSKIESVTNPTGETRPNNIAVYYYIRIN